jgi:hypothetical protein
MIDMSLDDLARAQLAGPNRRSELERRHQQRVTMGHVGHGCTRSRRRPDTLSLMNPRLLLVSLALSIPLLASACKRDSTTAPDGGSDSQVMPPEQEPALPPLECERPEDFGPVIVTTMQYAQRYAAMASKFSAVASTLEQPAEVCGIAAGIELMATLTCDDGRNPFGGDRQAAHSSRVGNVGPGGRCGSIIDHYVAPCPEGAFDIFIDSYICADAAAFQ